MQRLTGTLSCLTKAKVLLMGDLILDSYTFGKAKRISPEAPVAVLEVQREEQRAGGAGNVALNLISLSSEVVLVGRIGDDNAGASLHYALNEEGVDLKGIFVQKDYQTPVKNRIIAENQQIVRIDHEKFTALPLILEQEIIDKLPTLIEGVSVVSISDYGKGFLTPKILSTVIELANLRKIPIIVDPKGMNFSKYRGSTLIKPNLKEAYGASGLPEDAPLELVAATLLKITESEMLMITRSEAGISCFYKNGTQEDFPVRVKEVKDVTGAGDTVLSMLSIAMACQIDMAHTIQFCNLAAGIAIERFGCARVSLSDLARRLLECDFINKVFDEEHLFALQEALKGRKIKLLGLSGENGLTTAIFSTINQLSSQEDFDLLVYIRDIEPDQEFINVLASLQNVNFIILNTDNLRNLCNRIEPDEVYFLDGKQLSKLEHSASLFAV